MHRDRFATAKHDQMMHDRIKTRGAPAMAAIGLGFFFGLLRG
jgi:hypothetical protein